MCKKIFKTLLILFLAVGLTSIAFAQRQTGSVRGTIVDQDDAPIPGVSVTIAGEALITAQTFVSTDDGSFRFPALPPGEYTLTCEVPGFKTLNQGGIIVRVGKTTTLAVSLEIATIEEEVTVVAESPAVDVKASKVSVTITKELLDNLPFERDLYNVVNAAPGVVSENVTYRRTSSTHGSTVRGNRYAFDGVDMNDPVVAYPITNINFDLYEEVEMELAAHPAEIGNTDGAYVNIVTPSGGNTFHGSATGYFFTESLVSENFSPEELDSLGVASPALEKNITDLSLNIGGPVIKDRLWFFLAGRYLDYAKNITDFPADVEHTEYFGFGKLTLQITEGVRFMGMFNYVNIFEPYFSLDVSPTRDPQACAVWDHETGKTVNLQLNWILGPAAFLDVRGMWVNRWFPLPYQEGATHYTYNRNTGRVTGGSRWEETYDRGRTVGIAALTLFGDDVAGGDHELKVGFEFEKAHGTADVWHEDPIYDYVWDETSPYYFGPGSGMGIFLALGFGPQEDDGLQLNELIRYSAYVQDSFTIAERLTLNLGLRFDSSHGNRPEQYMEEVPTWMWLNPTFFAHTDVPEIKDVINWNTISPRIGFAFDVFGTGKTVLKGNYARYREYLMIQYFGLVNPNYYNYKQYLWIDNNMNGIHDPNTAVDTYIELYSFGREDPTAEPPIDPDLKAPYIDEVLIGVDHELLTDFRVGLNFMWKQHRNIFEDVEEFGAEHWGSQVTVQDPGYDAEFGTSDDLTHTLWDRTESFGRYIFTNPPDAWRKYRAMEFIFEKRMSNNWQLFGSVVWSKMWGTIGGEYGVSYGGSGGFDNPNWMINREGLADFDRPLVIKLAGTYILPAQIMLSGAFISSSGVPYARSVEVYLPGEGDYVEINAEMPGTRRRRSWNRLDIRVEKEFRIAGSARLGIYMDVFNALNSGYITSRSDFAGYIEADGSFSPYSLWNTVETVSVPRVFKIGARFTF